jgi:alpha-beta hydrolase superfamily lysophospholipase
MDYGNVVQGAILLGTGNQSAKLIKAAKMVVNGVTVIKGERFRSTLVNEILFGAYNREIENPLTKEDWICSDREALDKYRSDEKCGFIFTMNGLEGLLSTMEYIVDEKNIARLPKDVKMLLASGKEDPVGNYGEDVEELFNIYKSHGVKDISMELYDGCRHELLNEIIKKTIYADIYDWINEHIMSAK